MRALELLRSARVGRLATVTPEGRPHVVPCVFAVAEVAGDVRIYWAVDDKPKRSTRLQRQVNLEANASVELVVDAYDDDWDRLWWVRASGTGRPVEDPSERELALAALREKYPQYRELADDAPLVAIGVERLSGWSAA